VIIEPTSSLNVLITLAAYLIGLSMFVQVIQETYKFLSSSKSRTTRKVLQDFLGPLWNRAVTSGGLIDLQVRGPFQFVRLRPQGDLLPPDSDVISNALESTAPNWIQQVLTQLRFEARLQEKREDKSGVSSWSPAWHRLLEDLAAAEKGSTGYRTARELTDFLTTYGFSFKNEEGDEPTIGSGYQSAGLSAPQLIEVVRQRFLPFAVEAEKGYTQLAKNFEYAYHRRNIRQTFFFGMAVAFVFNLPFEAIYQAATRATPSQAAAVSAQAVALYEDLNQRHGEEPGGPGAQLSDQGAAPDGPSAPVDDESRDRLTQAVEDLGSALEVLPLPGNQGEPLDYVINWSNIKAYLDSGPIAVVRFLFGCLLTAVLVSLGAPFWNDITGLLVQMQKSRSTDSSGQNQ